VIECVQGGHTDERAIICDRETLLRRDAHAHAGERAGSRGDSKEIDVGDTDAVSAQQSKQIAGKPYSVCDARIAGVGAQQDAIAAQRSAALPGCRI
jgi:hypothetical protein